MSTWSLTGVDKTAVLEKHYTADSRCGLEVMPKSVPYDTLTKHLGYISTA